MSLNDPFPGRDPWSPDAPDPQPRQPAPLDPWEPGCPILPEGSYLLMHEHERGGRMERMPIETEFQLRSLDDALRATAGVENLFPGLCGVAVMDLAEGRVRDVTPEAAARWLRRNLRTVGEAICEAIEDETDPEEAALLVVPHFVAVHALGAIQALIRDHAREYRDARMNGDG